MSWFRCPLCCQKCLSFYSISLSFPLSFLHFQRPYFSRICWFCFNHTHWPHWAGFLSTYLWWIYSVNMITCNDLFVHALFLGSCSHSVELLADTHIHTHTNYDIHFDFWRKMLLIHHTNVISERMWRGRRGHYRIMCALNNVDDCSKCEK